MDKSSSTYGMTATVRALAAGYMVAAALLPMQATAQDANTVTLRFASDQQSMTGALIEFQDDKFLIDSKIGRLVIPAAGVSCVGDACPEETRLVLENSRVTLTSIDGTVTLDGDLIEVDGDEYVLATAVGEQRIKTALVVCKGEGCVDVAVEPVAEDTGDVTLTNGEITLTGELIGTDDGFYILKEVLMGEVRVSTEQFTCTGSSCPAL